MTLRRPVLPPHVTGLAATWLPVALLLVFAGWVRVRGLPSLFFSMDASHPIARAVDTLQGLTIPWRGEAVCFHFGALQTWVFVPILAVSRHMHDAMVINAWLHALGVVPMAVAGKQLGGRRAAWIAAALYACWPLLTLHPCRGAWTYHAPLFLALATMAAALALTGRSKVHVVTMAAAMACAIHFHPYAVAPVAAAALLVPRLIKLHGWRPLILGMIVGTAILAPMIVDNAQTLFGDRTNEGCSLVPPTPVPIMNLLMGSVFRVGVGWPIWAEVVVLLALPVGIVGVLVARRRLGVGGLTVLWALTSYGAVAVVAKLLSYMSDYHAAVLIPVHALALAWLFSHPHRATQPRRSLRVGAWVAVVAILASLVVGAVRVSTDALASSPLNAGRLRAVDRVGEAIYDHSGSRPASVVLVSDHTAVSMGEVLIYNADLWLRRSRPPEPPPEERFAAPGYAVITLRDTTWQDWGIPPGRILELSDGDGTTLAVVAYEDHKAALAGIRRVCALHPQWPGLEISDLSRSMAGLALAEDYVGGEASTQVEVLCRGGRHPCGGAE